MSDDIVRIEGLVKQFGSFRALDGLDLVVARGEVHGFLGPNGAGKSTTIRILLGLMRRDGGRITLYDRDPWNEGTSCGATWPTCPVTCLCGRVSQVGSAWTSSPGSTVGWTRFGGPS